jgi:hypothetical protein
MIVFLMLFEEWGHHALKNDLASIEYENIHLISKITRMTLFKFHNNTIMFHQ